MSSIGLRSTRGSHTTCRLRVSSAGHSSHSSSCAVISGVKSAQSTSIVRSSGDGYLSFLASRSASCSVSMSGDAERARRYSSLASTCIAGSASGSCTPHVTSASTTPMPEPNVARHSASSDPSSAASTSLSPPHSSKQTVIVSVAEASASAHRAVPRATRHSRHAASSGLRRPRAIARAKTSRVSPTSRAASRSSARTSISTADAPPSPSLALSTPPGGGGGSAAAAAVFARGAAVFSVRPNDDGEGEKISAVKVARTSALLGTSQISLMSCARRIWSVIASSLAQRTASTPNWSVASRSKTTRPSSRSWSSRWTRRAWPPLAALISGVAHGGHASSGTHQSSALSSCSSTYAGPSGARTESTSESSRRPERRSPTRRETSCVPGPVGPVSHSPRSLIDLPRSRSRSGGGSPARSRSVSARVSSAWKTSGLSRMSCCAWVRSQSMKGCQCCWQSKKHS